MRFLPSRLPGAFLIELEPHGDERGFFARTYCADEFRARGLEPLGCQASLSYNETKGTLRGLHFQCAPHEEAKLVRCVKGAIFDVIVDLRRESPCFGGWEAFELTAENRRSLYVPRGMAHGFQTLVDGSEVYYQISTPFEPDARRGVVWSDPELAIPWPQAQRTISQADRELPAFSAVRRAMGLP